MQNNLYMNLFRSRLIELNILLNAQSKLSSFVLDILIKAIKHLITTFR